MRTRCRDENNSRWHRSGAAAAEFAVVLPLLALLVFGCVDMGRSIAAYIILSNAACAGAQYGATHGFSNFTYAGWQSQVENAVTQEMQGTGSSFDSSRMTVTVTGTPTTGNLYQTKVSATYRFEMLTNLPGIPKEYFLRHSVTIDRYQ